MNVPFSERPNISDEIYDIIFDKILQGNFEIGRRLKIRELEIDLGVSRTPIISALQRLSENGLITNYPRRGYYVTKPSPDEILEKLEIRQVLESYAAEKVAEGASGKELKKLQTIITKMRKAMENRNHLDYINLDTQFHDLIISLSGNRSLINIYHSLRIQSLITGVRFSFPNPVHEYTHQMHERIFQCFQTRDGSGAKTAVFDHIQEVRNRFIEQNISEVSSSTALLERNEIGSDW